MRRPGLVLPPALLLLAGTLLFPAPARSMGLCFSTATPNVSVAVSPSSPDAGTTASVSCVASGGTVSSVTVTVSGGSLAGGGTATLAGPSGQVSWAVPGTAGTYTVQCDAVPGSSCTAAASSGPVAVTVGTAAVAPVVDGVQGPAGPVLAGASATFSAAAHDPAGGTLSYAWTATGGAIAGGGASATWVAPPVAGTYTVGVTVTGSGGRTSASTQATVALSVFEMSEAAPLRAPLRVAEAPGGRIFVVDASDGTLAILGANGSAIGTVVLPDRALALAAGPSSVFVSTVSGLLFRVDPGTGRVQPVPVHGAPLALPSGLAYDRGTGLLWVAERGANQVRALRPDGGTAVILTAAGAQPLTVPVDVAIEPGSGRVWVALQSSETANTLHEFDASTGAFVASSVPFGGGPGQVVRVGGLAAGGGRVYMSDAFQGVIRVLSTAGAALGTIGSFGDGAGQLRIPMGLAIASNGDLLVANQDLARVDRFGAGVAPPATCVVAGQLDTDCDGLPDWWELAHGLNPNWAGDALLAYGRTGMSAYGVYAYEQAYGMDPWTPPTVTVSAPALSPPGLVKLSAAPSGPPGYAVACAWRQVSGPASVTLVAANGISPSFIGRVAGTYAFEVVASTSLATGAAARVSVTVKNVAPIPDPGRITVVAPRTTVRLDGGFSSDANGDALTFAWDQTLGRPLTGGSSGAAVAVRPDSPGLYRFMLTATDPKGASSSAEVPVLVVEAPVSTAVAAAFPAAPQAGAAVTLDGTGSLYANATPEFAWAQVDGPAVALAGAERPVATFVPPAAGRYRFSLTVTGRDRRASPPALVDVFVASAGRPLPAVESASTSSSVVAVNTVVSLEAVGTGTGYAWRQVAGPAAGLTDADAGTASVVPFAPGAYVFEVVATDGAAVSPPARVTFEARAGGAPIPVARAAVLGLPPQTGQLVFLDGSASTGATRHRWTQVAGPWVVLTEGGPWATFRAHDPGTYAFELEVDDGKVRSAPARVEVVVLERSDDR